MAGEDIAVALPQWANNLGDKLARFENVFAQMMIAEVKKNTPVETGRLRASIGLLEPIVPGKPIMIGTNVIYARRIEYGFVGQDAMGRYYNQEGAAMFEKAAAHADDIAQRALDAVLNQPGIGTQAVEGGVIGGVEGGIEGGIVGFVTGGPAGAVAGAVTGAELGAAAGAAEPVVLGGQGSSGEYTSLGAGEGALLGAIEAAPGGRIAGAVLGAALGAGEGTVEGDIMSEDDPPAAEQP